MEGPLQCVGGVVGSGGFDPIGRDGLQGVLLDRVRVANPHAAMMWPVFNHELANTLGRPFYTGTAGLWKALIRIRVEVPMPAPITQLILAAGRLRGATTLRQAVEQSGILEQFPEIDLEQQQLGIFGKLNKPDTELLEGDRVEIYRPLIADPKEVRKQRAAAGKK
ncbi:RnfH family protein [Thiohalobacter thiocyanaticus]